MLGVERLIQEYLQATKYRSYSPDSEAAIVAFIEEDSHLPEVNKYQVAELIAALIADIKDIQGQLHD